MNIMLPWVRSTLNHKNIYSIRYSRQYLRLLDVDQKQVEQVRAKTQAQLKKQANFNRPSNDRNSHNYIKLRVNHPLYNVSYYPKDDVQTCAIMQPEPIKPRRFISATRNYIITSVKKAKDAMHPVKRLYVLDAINTLMGSHKKVAKLMVRTFWNLLDHAKQRGYDPMRLWVHGCLIGKTRRYFNVRYHAKGRGNRQKRDFCKVKVVMYEKQEQQFLTEIAQGKCPPGLANTVRRVLLQRQDTNYSSLTRYAYMTTAKGRQQASQLLKRRIDIKMTENQKNGIFVPKKQVRIDLLKEMTDKVRKDIMDLTAVYNDEAVLLSREQLYKKNMGIAD